LTLEVLHYIQEAVVDVWLIMKLDFNLIEIRQSILEEEKRLANGQAVGEVVCISMSYIEKLVGGRYADFLAAIEHHALSLVVEDANEVTWLCRKAREKGIELHV
jgi:hypothetical protein